VSSASLVYAGSRSVMKQVEAVGSRPPSAGTCSRMKWDCQVAKIGVDER
jgi:hypothetical protein